jgi:hypothetical protein
MKKRMAGCLFMSAILLASIAQSDASTDGKVRSFVYTSNQSTKWAWVTAYGVSESTMGEITAALTKIVNEADLGTTGAPGDTIQGAWCLGPGSAMDKRELTSVVHAVRIELKGPQCAANTKDVLDKTVAFKGMDPPNKATSAAKPGITNITGGGTKMIGTPPENVPGGNVQSDSYGGPGGPSYYIENIPLAVSASMGGSQ